MSGNPLHQSLSAEWSKASSDLASVLAYEREVVSQVFGEMIEQLAFMFAEPAAKNALGDPGDPCLRAQMEFNGPRRGTLTLAGPLALSREMAANILGLDAEDEMVVKHSADTLKEVLNVTCGNLLTALAGEAPVFELTVPSIAQISCSEWCELRDCPQTIALTVDDFPVLLHLGSNQPCPSGF